MLYLYKSIYVMFYILIMNKSNTLLKYLIILLRVQESTKYTVFLPRDTDTVGVKCNVQTYNWRY